MTFKTLLLVGAVALTTPGSRITDHGSQTVIGNPSSVIASSAELPPAPYGEAGPADSLYRLGRDAINKSAWRRAANYFGEIADKYPKSEYAPDALYWKAFALYRLGREDDLREALDAIDAQASRYPKAATKADAKELGVRIRGKLASQGDADAAEKVAKVASPAKVCSSDEDEDIRAAAMNALLQMDAESAVPIIKQVLQKRDECSRALREKAVFLLSQKQTGETEDLLIDVVKNDPAHSVREQGVFWLGQIHTQKAAVLLEDIAMNSNDEELRDKAIFSLSQQGLPRGFAVLRRLAESEQTPDHLREQSIFWLGQRRSQENADYLRGLFDRLGKSSRNDDIRKKILFSISQMHGFGNDRWLLSVAMDSTNDAEVRGHALWTAGQNGVGGAALADIYDRVKDQEIKEKLIFTLSQSGDGAATDKLIAIAQNDPDREMRKKALFWLGQKNDPRVRDIIMKIINKP